ncbi:MAG TPA: Gfo/Idh/MocA family oxidoreductase, partial [Bacillota bacterium]|nr:Gfo/Idh/MocA family oxidoreductase [Bacillota bacterium]
MTQMGIVVVGAGYMGTKFARLLHARPDARLVGVYDLDAPRAHALAEQCGTRPLRDLDEALTLPDVQGVVVATPEQDHLVPCMAAAAAGLPVLVEKPLAADSDVARR